MVVKQYREWKAQNLRPKFEGGTSKGWVFTLGNRGIVLWGTENAAGIRYDAVTTMLALRMDGSDSVFTDIPPNFRRNRWA